MINTAVQTMANASRVPMFTSSAKMRSGRTAPMAAQQHPVKVVAFQGVRKRSWIAAKNPGGSRPSRAMARKILGWLNIMTRSTEVMPATAPTETSNSAHGSPTCRNASDTGASILIWLYGTIPVSTADTAIYNTVHKTNETMMPMGTSREGFLASSAWVDAESNPI